jgi:hypothetical protein
MHGPHPNGPHPNGPHLNGAVLTRRYLALRGRLHPATWPALVAGAAVASAGYVAVVNPDVPGHYPTCPFYALTGYYCPGCGTLRAIHALLHGQVGQAFGYNVLSMAMLPVLGYFWYSWLVRSVQGRPRQRLAHPAWIWGFAALTAIFWVARNLPLGHVLAPTGHI